MRNISENRRLFEIVAALLTGLGKIIFVDILDESLIFILTVSVFWIGYVIWRYHENTENLKYWGFRKDNFKKSFLRLLPYALVSVGLFGIYGFFFDTLLISWHIIPLLLLYPIWGVIQQFLVVGLVAGNLYDQTTFRIPKWLIIMLTAFLFSLVHFPSMLLISGTFLLAIVYSSEYLKERNLWTLGLYHGWLACFFYYLVLHRDPFLEVFGKLM